MQFVSSNLTIIASSVSSLTVAMSSIKSALISGLNLTKPALFVVATSTLIPLEILLISPLDPDSNPPPNAHHESIEDAISIDIEDDVDDNGDADEDPHSGGSNRGNRA